MSFRIWCARKLRRSATLLCLWASCHGAERWKIQYSYAKADSTLEIADLQCPSPQRCIAAGIIGEKNGHTRGVTLLTSDGGKNWSVADVRERPASLYFLNDSLGWMVTDRGVWATNESGRTWKKLEAPKKGLLRVHFLDATHGFAIGVAKTVYQTADGGKTWAKLAAADSPNTSAENTVYNCMSFLGQHGVITGKVTGPADEREPIWLNPSQASLRQQRRSTVVMLETLDGGKTWKASTSTAYGDIAQIQLAPDGSALALFEYREYYSVPSSVVKLNLASKSSKTLFSERDRAVTDFALLPGGEVLLAAVEPPGASNQVPIPGKLKMLKSHNLRVWEEMDVDYRAVAQGVTLAGRDRRHVWAATDTGMILQLLDTEDSSR